MHIPPPVPFTAAWLAQTAMTRERPEGRRPPKALRAAAAITGATAALAMGATFAQFQLSRTTVDPAHPERASTLIVTGPNRLTRNPIYLGFAGLLVAHAMWRGSGRALLLTAAFAVAVTPQIEREEEALLARFGRDYAGYLRRVPRWIGPFRD